MPFPLHLRVQLDAAESQKCYLVNACYGTDFVPTRDRSIPYGSMWTFKCCRSEFQATALTRGSLRQYSAIVFGRVDHIRPDVGPVCVVTLTCPESKNVQVAELFGAQLRKIESIIKEDSCDMTGSVISSWISMLWRSVQLPYKAGAFYVDFPPELASTLSVGRNIEAIVRLRRETADLDTGENNYVSIYLPRSALFHISSVLHGPLELQYVLAKVTSACSPPTVMSSYLQEYCSLGSMTLSLAQYPRDFVPTRERTLAGGDLFTYKGVGSIYETFPTATRGGCLRKYEGCAFGEIVSTEALHSKAGVVVKLQCPTDASCLDAEIYMGQLRTLQCVVDVENSEMGDCIRSTWFASPVSDPESRGNLADGVVFFYLMGSDEEDFNAWRDAFRPGLILEVWLSLQRIDTLCRQGHLIRDYSLLATSIGVLEKADILRRGRGYVSPPLKAVPHGSLPNSRPAGCGVYPIDFVANRVASTRGGSGSIFIYKPTGDYPTFGLYQQKHSIGSYSMTFAGTVSEIWDDPEFEGKPVSFITLGLPEEPNGAAVAIMARQKKALLAISKVDVSEAEGLHCVTVWGHSENEYQAPVVCIALARVKLALIPVKVGDDIVLNARLTRVDTPIDGKMELRYFLEGSAFGKMRADQLRNVNVA
ncbi:hypothetical protein C8R47DRAFT_1220162 [Mycena vitilis]|nr:hypothetical protein C8R47DRAFT_1220162 [Mycena vitilis]